MLYQLRSTYHRATATLIDWEETTSTFMEAEAAGGEAFERVCAT